MRRKWDEVESSAVQHGEEGTRPTIEEKQRIRNVTKNKNKQDKLVII